jgi:hypothetical protein
MEELFDELHLGTQDVTKINDCNFVLPKQKDLAMYNSEILLVAVKQDETDERMIDPVNADPPLKRHTSSKKESKRNMKKHRRKLLREHIAKKKSTLLSQLPMQSSPCSKQRKKWIKLQRKHTNNAKLLTRIQKRQLKTEMRGIQKTLALFKCS